MRLSFLVTRAKDKKKLIGFTLIEILVVISLIGLLAAMILVGVRGFRDRAHDVQIRADVKGIATSFESYGMDNGDKYPESVNSWGIKCLAERLGSDTSVGGDSILVPRFLSSIPTYVRNGSLRYYMYASCGDEYMVGATISGPGRRFVARSEGLGGTTDRDTDLFSPTFPGVLQARAERGTSTPTTNWTLSFNPATDVGDGIAYYAIELTDYIGNDHGTTKIYRLVGKPSDPITNPVQVPFVLTDPSPSMDDLGGLKEFGVKMYAVDKALNASVVWESDIFEI
ncbi:MAG: prepilin-type N-terminal cleavage/methylation domain-containing protein [bacterium]|nr:prepilin-type N-terminal cleavage/methylation domain-containing protein [bacterium]